MYILTDEEIVKEAEYNICVLYYLMLLFIIKYFRKFYYLILLIICSLINFELTFTKKNVRKTVIYCIIIYSFNILHIKIKSLYDIKSSI